MNDGKNIPEKKEALHPIERKFGREPKYTQEELENPSWH
jgi:hypothetical protein